ncbi:MAG: hypothetical protein WAP47_00215, partial [Candidatus Rokuibacteriota bacterium]
LLLAAWGGRRAAEGLTGALLWFAAAGGSLLLLLYLGVGAPVRWLVVSVPFAWLALWAWRRRRRLER